MIEKRNDDRYPFHGGKTSVWMIKRSLNCLWAAPSLSLDDILMKGDDDEDDFRYTDLIATLNEAKSRIEGLEEHVEELQAELLEARK